MDSLSPNNSKISELINASIMTSIFIVITVISDILGIGFLGYYDYVVPIFFTLISIKTSDKYAILSIISSFFIIFLVRGNPIASIMIVQGGILGLVVSYLINSKSNFSNDLIIVSIASLISLFVFDHILSLFTNISIIDSYAYFVEEMNKMIKDISEISGGSIGNILEIYKDSLNSGKFVDIYYMSIALISLGTGFIIYFGAIVVATRTRISINNSDKIGIVNKKNRGNTICKSSSKMAFIFMTAYVIVFYMYKSFFNLSDVNFINTVLFSTMYIFMFFLFKECFVLVGCIIFLRKQNRRILRLYKLGIIVSIFLSLKLLFWILLAVYYLLDNRFIFRSEINSI